MSKELIIIYAALGFIIFMQIFNLVISFSLKKRINKSIYTFSGKDSKYDKSAGVVFCKKCGNQFPTAAKVCPHCGVKK